MKVTLHMAISIDGYVAKSDGDSNWISPIDEKLFIKRVGDAGCIIVGRKTYEQYKNEIYPLPDVLNIILTKGSLRDGEVVSAKSPKEALEIAGKKGFTSVLLAGGGSAAASFLRENLIDEIFLTLHPLILGEGIKLFNGLNSKLKFKLIDSEKIGSDLIQLHYKIS